MHARSYLKRAFGSLGYKGGQICEGYRFAAVDQPSAPVRTAALAAFFDIPPSYRNAALAVIDVADDVPIEPQLLDRQAIGAPYLIALSERQISAWALSSRGVARIDSAPTRDVEAFFSRHSINWKPDSIRRLKAPPLRRAAVQQSLFDPATIYTIQTQVHEALDGLLRSFLAFFEQPKRSQLAVAKDYRLLLPIAFRLLTGKILLDRENLPASVDGASAEAVIAHVTQRYSLPSLPLEWTAPIRVQLDNGWAQLAAGLYVRNIAADDLAFVYENTLITEQTRRQFGTHSTPVPVAEYVLRSFQFPEGDALRDLRVYEPFAGSCVFLTAAMRRFKEILPADWAPPTMHRHLVSHFNASEVDAFAAELAKLSLILADYPNPNGWKIEQEDLFEGDLLMKRTKAADVIVCNPPFEAFVEGESRPEATTTGVLSKPHAALDTFLQHPPRYLGMVMPPAFTVNQGYRRSLERLVETYGDIEFLDLPEGVFPHADVGASVIVAQAPRVGRSPVRLTRSRIFRSDLPRFSRTLEPSTSECRTIDPSVSPGIIGLQPLRDLWEYLQGFPRLEQIAEIHRGLEWNIDQAEASSPQPRSGYREGLHRIDRALAQFRILQTTYLNCREEDARGRALQLPWQKPKVACSAVRMSRGPWRIAACEDVSGLVLSQQFFGIWPKRGVRDLLAITALLNGPLANAWCEIHDTDTRLRVSRTGEIPIPASDFGPGLEQLISEYRSAIAESGPLFSQRGESQLADMLLEIDAMVLSHYDLPPKLEKVLLQHMSEGVRPCGHPFGPYPGAFDRGAIGLSMRIAGRKRPPLRRHWAQVLQPLPKDVADALDVI